MSIAIKKFMTMLDLEIANQPSLSEEQKKILKKLCEKIYVLETTNDSSLMPAIIRDEVKFYSKDYEAKV